MCGGFKDMGGRIMTGLLHRIEGVVYPPPEQAAFYSERGAWERQTFGQALRNAAKIAPD